MSYKVLWIDNEPDEEFVVSAYDDYGLDIINKENYVEGLEWLKKNREICLAVILDVNCIEGDVEEESESMDVFTNNLPDVIKLCEREDHFIPWYVYTGGGYEGFDTLKRVISDKRDWDPLRKEKYYNKPKDRERLFENIQKAIQVSPLYNTIKQYNDIFEEFSSKENTLSLLRIIEIVNSDNTNNSSAYNDIRKVLEATAKLLKAKGLFPDDQDGLSAASYYIRNICFKSRQNIVPSYISYCFTACEDICNDGSHDGGKTPMRVDRDTAASKAPYLIRSAFYMLCSVIIWSKSLPNDPAAIEELKGKVQRLNIDTYNKNRTKE